MSLTVTMMFFYLFSTFLHLLKIYTNVHAVITKQYEYDTFLTISYLFIGYGEEIMKVICQHYQNTLMKTKPDFTLEETLNEFQMFKYCMQGNAKIKVKLLK